MLFSRQVWWYLYWPFDWYLQHLREYPLQDSSSFTELPNGCTQHPSDPSAIAFLGCLDGAVIASELYWMKNKTQGRIIEIPLKYSKTNPWIKKNLRQNSRWTYKNIKNLMCELNAYESLNYFKSNCFFPHLLPGPSGPGPRLSIPRAEA